MPRKASFEREAIPHFDTLMRTALRLSGDRARAEDAVQETYLRAWHSFQTYTPDTNCRAWLFTDSPERLKENGREKNGVTLCLAPRTSKRPSKVISLFPASGEEKGEGQDILAAVNQLPPQFRQVLWLVVVEGFAYKETAQMLDIPIGTVMSRLYRARRELRRLLAEARAAARRKDLRPWTVKTHTNS